MFWDVNFSFGYHTWKELHKNSKLLRVMEVKLAFITFKCQALTWWAGGGWSVHSVRPSTGSSSSQMSQPFCVDCCY